MNIRHLALLVPVVACQPNGGVETVGETMDHEMTPTFPPVEPPADCERAVEWSVRFGGPTSDTVKGFAVDPAGNIYLGLDLRNLIDASAPVKFGDFEVVPGQYSNIVIVKLTTEGEVAWVRDFVGPGDQYLWTLAPCGDGVVFQGSADPGTLDLGKGVLQESDFFASLDGAGDLRWTRAIPKGPGDPWLFVADMACDAGMNLAMTGNYSGVVDLGSGPTNGPDGFVARFDAAGMLLWSRGFGDQESSGVGVAYTPAGDIVVAAHFARTIELGGVPLDATEGNILLAEFDGTGEHVWSRTLGPSGFAGGVAVDSAGRIAVGGIFLDTLKLGSQTYTNIFPNADEEVYGTVFDGFLALTGPDGELQWSLHLASMLQDDIDRLAFDADDTLITSGHADKKFLLRAFVGPMPDWSWCTPKLFQVHAGLSGNDSVIIAPWGVEGDLDLGAGLMPGAGDSDVVVAKIRR